MPRKHVTVGLQYGQLWQVSTYDIQYHPQFWLADKINYVDPMNTTSISPNVMSRMEKKCHSS